MYLVDLILNCLIAILCGTAIIDIVFDIIKKHKKNNKNGKS